MRQTSYSARSRTVYLLATLALSACVQPPALVIEGASGEAVPLESWSADLTAIGATGSAGVRGRAVLLPGANIRETRAMVTVSGGTPNAVYPWYVQLGDCANDRGVLESLMVYPPLAVDSSGQATATATLSFTLPTTGRYFVSVRRSETEVSTVIACGNLTRAGSGTAEMAGYAKAP